MRITLLSVVLSFAIPGSVLAVDETVYPVQDVPGDPIVITAELFPVYESQLPFGVDVYDVSDMTAFRIEGIEDIVLIAQPVVIDPKLGLHACIDRIGRSLKGYGFDKGLLSTSRITNVERIVTRISSGRHCNQNLRLIITAELVVHGVER